MDTSGSAYGVYNFQRFDNPPRTSGRRVDTHNQTALVGGNNTGTWFAPLAQSVDWFDEFAYEEFFPYNAIDQPDFPNNGPDQSRLRFTLAAQDTRR